MLKEKKTYKDDMLVGDLVENREFDINCQFEIYDWFSLLLLMRRLQFDINCQFEIYDCTEKGADWQKGAKKIFSTIDEGWVIPNDKILAMRVQYITLDVERKALVIEAGKVA